MEAGQIGRSGVLVHHLVGAVTKLDLVIVQILLQLMAAFNVQHLLKT